MLQWFRKRSKGRLERVRAPGSRAARLGLEQLEDRQLLSTLAAAGGGIVFIVGADGSVMERTALGTLVSIAGPGSAQSVSAAANRSSPNPGKVDPVEAFYVTRANGLVEVSETGGLRQIGGDGTIRDVSAGNDLSGHEQALAITTSGGLFNFTDARGFERLGGDGSIKAVKATTMDREVAITGDNSVFEFDRQVGWFRLTSAGFAATISAATDDSGTTHVYVGTADGTLFQATLQDGFSQVGDARGTKTVSAGTDEVGVAQGFVLTPARGLFEINSDGSLLRLGGDGSVARVVVGDSGQAFVATTDGSVFSLDQTNGFVRITSAGFADLTDGSDNDMAGKG